MSEPMQDQTRKATAGNGQKNAFNETMSSDAEVTVRQMQQAIEAILYAAGYPVAYEKISAVIGLPIREVKTLVAHMADEYEERGIQLMMYPETCQLCTREEFAPYIREALGIRRGGNLSASSMEVLAVVAYNQPVTRSYIDTIRGMDSSYAVTSLLDKGLIQATGRLDAPGRPVLYGTTDKFLRVFGLASLSELPSTDAFSAAEAPPDSPVTAQDSEQDSESKKNAPPTDTV